MQVKRGSNGKHEDELVQVKRGSNGKHEDELVQVKRGSNGKHEDDKTTALGEKTRKPINTAVR